MEYNERNTLWIPRLNAVQNVAINTPTLWSIFASEMERPALGVANAVGLAVSAIEPTILIKDNNRHVSGEFLMPNKNTKAMFVIVILNNPEKASSVIAKTIQIESVNVTTITD